MLRIVQCTIAMAALALFSLLYVPSARADDAATTQPSAAGNGTVSVTVMDASGKPAAGVRVRLAFPRPKGGAARPAPMTGTTDENGAFTFNGLAPGNYTVSAGMRRGAHGQAKVTLPEGDNGAAPTASITVNLEAPATQPS